MTDVEEELKKFIETEREKFERIDKRERKYKQQRMSFAAALAMGSILGVSSIGYKLLVQDRPERFDASSLIAELYKQRELVEVPDYEKAKEDLVSSLKSTMEESGDRPFLGLGNAILTEDLSRLKSRIELLEKAISDNPEKALSIPMLRRDYDELGRKFEEYRISAKVDSDRLWAQQNTILQGIGALLLAVAAGAVTILYRAVKSGKGQD